MLRCAQAQRSERQQTKMAKHLLICALFLISYSSSITAETVEDFLQRRSNAVHRDSSQMMGAASEELTEDEQKVNEYLLKLKQAEIAISSEPMGRFPPAEHFFSARPMIEQSPIFNIIKMMPKGSALHVHDMAFGNLEFLIHNITHDPMCYMCYDSAGELNFKFFKSKPSDDCAWMAVNDMRLKSENPELFDQMLLNNVTMIVPNPQEAFPTQAAVWKQFLAVFKALAGLVFYGPVVEDFFYEAVLSLIKDNVQYVEIRSLLPTVYEADGTEHDMKWLMDALSNVNKRLLNDYPDKYTGFKLILTSNRAASREVIRDAINTTLWLRSAYPDFMAGYDLVAHEDPGFTLKHFLPELLYPSQIGQNLPFFFHAGETDWEGIGVDMNILDALLLNTSRIGHGYAITKHPWAMEEARRRDIPVEVNPISNQVLKYVDDLRNHPASHLMATDFPMVISADDPSLWGVRGLSYDFYVAFVGIGGAKSDLRTLKKLAKNSIRYSAMSETERRNLMAMWENKWRLFIQQILHQIS